jgi:hypothetical protein
MPAVRLSGLLNSHIVDMLLRKDWIGGVLVDVAGDKAIHATASRAFSIALVQRDGYHPPAKAE